MSTTQNLSRHLVSPCLRCGFAAVKCVPALALVALLFSLCAARADGPDDDYLRIYGIIDQADTLSANGKADTARAKYLEAQKQLVELKKNNPTWNAKVISYRMNYLSGKLAAPAEKATASETDTTKAPPIARPDPKPATPAAGVHVKLIAAGAEPRKVLRLHPQPGDKQSLGMTIKMAMEMEAEGEQTPAMKMPAMQMGMEVTVKSVSAEGDISYEAKFAEAGVAEGADDSAPMADAINSSLASIKGMTGTGVTSARGVSKSIDFKVPPGADPQVRQSMDQMKTAMSQVSLPEEAVGLGAKWEVKQKLKTQGLTVDQTETYEITAMEGEVITLRAGIVQQAANQKMQSPAMPGMKVDITRMDTKGTGSTTVNLGKLMPTAAAMDGHTEMSMGMNVGGQKQTMTMKMDMTAKLESK